MILGTCYIHDQTGKQEKTLIQIHKHRYSVVLVQTQKELTVSVSSVIVQENFVIGCFSYNGLLILFRADKEFGETEHCYKLSQH